MKKTILFSIFIICSLLGFSQSAKKWRGSYLINGYLNDESVKNVTLQYVADSKRGMISDTLCVPVANHKFSFSGYTDEPIFATLLVDGNELHFYIDPSVMDLEVGEDNKNFTIKGSVTSDEYLEIEALRKGFYQKNEKDLTALYNKQKNTSLSDIDETNRIHIRITNLEAETDLAALTFAAKEKGSFAVLREMDGLLKPENKYYKREVCAQMLRIYSQMPESLKDTPTGVNVSGKLLMASLNMKF